MERKMERKLEELLAMLDAKEENGDLTRTEEGMRDLLIAITSGNVDEVQEIINDSF